MYSMHSISHVFWVSLFIFHTCILYTAFSTVFGQRDSFHVLMIWASRMFCRHVFHSQHCAVFGVSRIVFRHVFLVQGYAVVLD